MLMQDCVPEEMFFSLHFTSVELCRAQKEITQLEVLQKASAEKIDLLEKEIDRLKEQLKLSHCRQFGRKSEVGEPTTSLGNSAETVKGYTRQRGKKSCGRLIDTSLLPRHTIHHDLMDAEKVCDVCCRPLTVMGEESAEQIEVLPLKLYMAEHVRHKYTCRFCKTVKMAPKEKAPIPKAAAGSSLLAEIVVNKYQYHLPLYRQSKILSSYNAQIPDNTLGNWVIQLGTGLMKVYEALWEAVLSQQYLQVDETPVKLLKPEKQGYLWSYFAPHLGKGVVVFELSLTRSGKIADQRLETFYGLLQTDGYNGYQELRQRKGIVGLGCFTHARRKFSEVLKITKNPEGIAAQAIERLKPLYALESRMREANYSFAIRKRLRQKIAWPLLKAFRGWLKKMLPQVPSRSQLANAMLYTLRQWPYLIRYLRHGMAEIDTNWVENQIRDIALGKKNWLFIGNESSGTTHAIFYSLVLSCILNNLNPHLYLHYIITQIHDLRVGKIDPQLLLPHTLDHDKLKAFADKQLETAKQILDSS